VADAVHTEHEDHGWTVEIPDHPARTDSAAYRASRRLMGELVKAAQPWFLGPGPYQDHHGAGIWVKDESGWMLLLGVAGIEWSAQFCADPAKVDVLRQEAQRVVAKFPLTIPAYAELGYSRGEHLLTHTVTTADDVADWTDGIFNASVPLPAAMHTGVLPHGAGYHHYPKPIVDILTFKYDDFTLFVTDEHGQPMAVLPVSPRGAGDGRVAIAWAPPESEAGRAQIEAEHHGARAILPDTSEVAHRAYALQ
jgi:hypothetical protein